MNELIFVGRSLPFQRIAMTLRSITVATEIPISTLAMIAELTSNIERMILIDHISTMYEVQGLVPHDTLSDFLTAVARQAL